MARDRMGKYTQREWDRTVGYGPVPEEYKDNEPEDEKSEKKSKKSDLGGLQS